MTDDNLDDVSPKLKGVDIEKFAGSGQSVYAKEIWNAAIEAAAKKASGVSPFEYIEAAIRSLKK